jgi:polysaccharide deacetylase family protein (PEP-CTERM system associated)
MNPVRNALTFDYEDWYHGIEIPPEKWAGFEERIGLATDRLLGILERTQCRATFFVLGWLAERRPDLVRRLQAGGHEIGTHGYSHRLVYTMTPDEFREDIRRSIELLTGVTGAAVTSYRAPFFSITTKSLWALDILAELGIRMDSSIFPVHNYRYGIPDAPRDPHVRVAGGREILEIPISVIKFMGQNVPVSGGAYFRILPYWVTLNGIRSLNRQNKPAVFYLHPWEVDPEHPRIPLPRRIALTHYHNLAATAPRLERLLRDLPFGPLEDVFRAG